MADPFPRLMTRVNRRPVVRRRNRAILMTCVNTGGSRLMTCVNRRTVVRVLRVAAQRNLLRFTPIHAYFMGCLPGIYSDLRYSRRILGFFCRNSAGFSRYFGPQMGEIRVICRRAANFVTCVNRRTVVRAVLSLKSPAGAGVSREFYSQMRFIPVACDRSQGKYPARYIAVRASSRALGCTEFVRKCTVSVRFLYGFARKSGEKQDKIGPVRAAQGAPGTRAPSPHAGVAGRPQHAHDRLTKTRSRRDHSSA